MRRLSIHQRLLLAASLVLTAFFGFTGLALDNAFRSATEEALEARLFSSVYALLAAAEEDAEGRLTMPDALTDPRFNRPDSGLYALVSGSESGYRWRSGSALGRNLSFSRTVVPGESRIEKAMLPGDEAVMSLSFGVVWEDFQGRELIYTLAVAEDLKPLFDQVSTFRNRLFFWLGGAALLLLLVQGLVLRWGLAPLRDVADAVTDIESGHTSQLHGDYPKELTPLTSNINSLIHHASARQQRYRDSLGDLAHSLKTPLAILQGLADQSEPIEDQEQRLLSEQVVRMNQIVGHQLQRAAASGRTSLSSALPVKPIVQRIANTLQKVYADKNIAWRFELPESLSYQGDEADLMEMLGNLMENACKYGRGKIRISGMAESDLILKIEDDGPGISNDQVSDVLQRGHRADQRTPGQGIGLAVVMDIVNAYKGNLSIGRSDRLGGTEMTLSLPFKY
ncbi:MAG: GHKL domain-containing protein [Candidatus Thiodiazotropha sp. (ex Monitilora ramsayi)]|nr:GHKL domain-containing protein [Candidatus Thiodiazotropha sp. (ex Monitilora ramsayi)]